MIYGQWMTLVSLDYRREQGSKKGSIEVRNVKKRRNYKNYTVVSSVFLKISRKTKSTYYGQNRIESSRSSRRSFGDIVYK